MLLLLRSDEWAARPTHARKWQAVMSHLERTPSGRSWSRSGQSGADLVGMLAFRHRTLCDEI